MAHSNISGPDLARRSRTKRLGYVDIANKKENNLGMPLPKGAVRVYKADGDGSLQFIGEDRIDHTPKDETIKIKMGRRL